MAVAKNDITGDAIQSKLSTENYSNNYDTIFKKELKVLTNGYGEAKQTCSERCWLEVKDREFICNKPSCSGLL